MNRSVLKILLLFLFALISDYAIAQKTISGTVTDENGNMLPGVSIIIQGTTTGAVTNLEGYYTISVPDESVVLQYSFIGYLEKSIPVEGNSTINVQLFPEVQTLDEIVVIGYGTRKKANLTGAVSTVKFDEKLTSRSLANVSTSLAGMVPGLSVRQGSGMPGNNNTELLIRGLGTVNNANPLIVVDGVPDVDIDRIDMNDVESISVLKDAASSAVYGSRAANGVILITTKSGSSGGAKIRYSGSYASTSPIKFYDNLTSYPKTMALHIRGANAGNKESVYQWGAIEEWMAKGLLDPVLYPNTDWYDVIFQNGVLQNHNISASGGDDKLNFYISAGLSDQTGVVINNDFKRYNFRTNLEYKVRKSITVGTRIDGQYSEMEYGMSDGIGGSGIRNTNPGVTPIHPVTGQYGAAMAYGENKQASNLYAEYSIDHNQKSKTGINGSLYGIWSPLKGLTTRIDYGLIYMNQFARDWSDPSKSYNLQTGEVVSILVGDNAGISNRFDLDTKTNFQARIDYQNEIFSGHNLGLMVAFTEESWNERMLSGSRNDRLYPNILEISAALPTIQEANGSSSAEGLRAFIGRLNYDINDRYLIEFSARYDGSSKFSEANQYGFFPSASAGWRISEEDFFSSLKDKINYAKLRISWGALGNNSGVGRYEQKETFETTNYILNNQIVKGFSYSKMIDPYFSWESTQVLNVGLDAGFFDNMIYAEFDYYDRLTTGMIRPSDLSDFLFGYQAPRINVGNLRNRGVESNITFNKRFGDMQFMTNFNLSYNVNNLEKWNEYLSPGNVFLNMPYQYIYSYKDQGIIQSWNEIINGPFQSNYIAPGDILLKDINGDGTIGGEDRLAYPEKMQRRPSINSSLTLNFAWKGFDFSTFINGTAGRYDFWGDNLTTTSPRDNRFNFSQFHWTDTWNYYNRDATMPRMTISAGEDGGRNGTDSNFWLQNRSFLRLKNVQLGYSLPKALINKIQVHKFRVYFTADNLLTFTKWQGIDPEKDTSGDDFYPLLKSYAFGVNIEF
ncbi:MAG: TonB-dependent receptor [Bacteroidales bacterium]|nr:TonB-dependent receptor [Bacteroidales bacterium]MCF8391302.1 TonB-dependent receptor [Bacteroidales bacterium]